MLFCEQGDLFMKCVFVSLYRNSYPSMNNVLKDSRDGSSLSVITVLFQRMQKILFLDEIMSPNQLWDR